MTLLIDGRITAAGSRETPGPLREYVKTATTMAVQVGEPFEVETEEGTMQGAAGDYLCVGPAGEAWPVKAAIFENTYASVGADRGEFVAGDAGYGPLAAADEEVSS